MSESLRHCLFPLVGFLFLSLPGESRAESPVDANAVKAKMLLNFPLVVEWPVTHRHADEKIRICTLGTEDQLVHQLQNILRRESDQRNELVPGVLASELPSCDVLYVDEHSQAAFAEYRPLLDGQPILTVGEGKNFLTKGGMIAFVSKIKQIGVFSRQTVRFHVHPNRIHAHGISLDPMLLELADRIVEGAS
jgi:hypothetical protein